MSLSRNELLRYSRQLFMADIGEAGQQKLKAASVLVVGMGGLGCPVAIYLAAAGIGKLAICDADVVEQSNLQRQILYRDFDCGELKVECALRELEAINPDILVRAIDSPFSANLLAEPYDIVVDCTDNLSARKAINSACVRAGIPFVSASALGWEGQLMAFDFSRQPSPCLACVFPENDEPRQNCDSAGVLGPVLGTMGSMQATTVIRMVLGYFDQHGVIQRYDGKRGQWLQLTAAARAGCPVCDNQSIGKHPQETIKQKTPTKKGAKCEP